MDNDFPGQGEWDYYNERFKLKCRVSKYGNFYLIMPPRVARR